MKKIVCVFCALAFSADMHGLDTDTEVKVQEQPADDQNNHAAYNGLYFGIGVNVSSLGESSRYLDAGDNTDEKMSGFGRTMPRNPFYMGVELGYDFSPNSTFSHYDKVDNNVNHFYDVWGKRNGSMFIFGVRLGWVDRDTQILTSIKIGGSWSKTDLRYNAYEIMAVGQNAKLAGCSDAKVSTFSPSIALCWEKNVGKSGTIRSEVEYTFGKSKEAQVHRTDEYNTWIAAGNASTINDNDRIKLEKKGTLTWRVAVCYHINFFNKGRIFTIDK